jgi:hypothetical protein
MTRVNWMRNEKGTVLVVSLLILLVLTIIALSLINTSTFEVSISGNERARMEAFYAAEGGIQRALSQIPSTDPVPRTKLGRDSYYWSGTVREKGNPTRLESLGLAFHYGTEFSEIGFKRIRIRMTGESSGAVRELEVQVKCSQSIPPSTEY